VPADYCVANLPAKVDRSARRARLPANRPCVTAFFALPADEALDDLQADPRRFSLEHRAHMLRREGRMDGKGTPWILAFVAWAVGCSASCTSETPDAAPPDDGGTTPSDATVASDAQAPLTPGGG
jgi:hypothetical protein